MRAILKIIISLILAIIMVASFAGCDSNSDNKNSTPEEKQVWLLYKQKHVSHDSEATYYYNEYGNVIKIVYSDKSGNWQSEHTNEYDENQNLIKTTVDTGDGTPFVQLIQAYDDKGNLIERRELVGGEAVYTYQYDEQNRRISTSSDGRIIETYTYESDGSYKLQETGFPDEYVLYHSNGRIKEIVSSTSMRTIYTYNENWVLLDIAWYRDDVLYKRKVYTLDENGNPAKCTEINSLGAETVLYETEYKLYTVKTK